MCVKHFQGTNEKYLHINRPLIFWTNYDNTFNEIESSPASMVSPIIQINFRRLPVRVTRIFYYPFKLLDCNLGKIFQKI